MEQQDIVLILGSSPTAIESQAWPRHGFSSIVALNNAWKVRDDWDYLVVPDDFPEECRPMTLNAGQEIVGSAEYVPANNRFGGVVYAGGTMAFSAGYWALAALRPRVMAFFGCDMVYPEDGPTHFYGSGTADPLREDATLRDLEAKSARLMLHAARLGCACVRLSGGASRLVFPSADRGALTDVSCLGPAAGGQLFYEACMHERNLGYYVNSGRYWLHEDRFSPDEIDKLDSLWLRAAAV
ncbi:MAG: hypothetical protein AAGA28_12645 [Pseudomonadota bacterium]